MFHLDMRNCLRPMLLILVVTGALSGCLPDVIIVDRLSVIEEESAGAWTDIERDLSLLHGRVAPVREVQPSVQSGNRAVEFLPTGTPREKSQKSEKSKTGEGTEPTQSAPSASSPASTSEAKP